MVLSEMVAADEATLHFVAPFFEAAPTGPVSFPTPAANTIASLPQPTQVVGGFPGLLGAQQVRAGQMVGHTRRSKPSQQSSLGRVMDPSPLRVVSKGERQKLLTPTAQF